METVSRIHPELERFVFLADRSDGFFDPKDESFTVISSVDLCIPNWRWFHFKYTLIEVCTAVKPYALDSLLRDYHFDFVVYLDPDILVFSRLVELEHCLENASLILTPHLTAPLHDGERPCELDILRSGVYNLGFVAIRNTGEALALLEWWKERLYDFCLVDLPRGLFLDQRWADFLPCFVSRFEILRDPAYNVAYWNLAQRNLEISNGTFVINGSPLRFFHFSGFDPQNPECLSRSQSRIVVRKRTALEVLLNTYAEQLNQQGHADCSKWPYAYGSFENGVPIPDVGRSIQWQRNKSALMEDPFSDEGYTACVSFWNATETSTVAPGASLRVREEHRTLAIVQSAMPDVFGGKCRSFLRWLLSGAARDRDLPDGFLVRGANGNLPEQRSARGSSPPPTQLMTNLARRVYERRLDLQAVFPDPEGRDAVKFLAWMLTHGRRECELPPAGLDRMRDQWQSVLANLPNLRSRVWHRIVFWAWTIHAALPRAAARFLSPSTWLPKRDNAVEIKSNLKDRTSTPPAVSKGR
jgi:hypothetical protein